MEQSEPKHIINTFIDAEVRRLCIQRITKHSEMNAAPLLRAGSCWNTTEANPDRPTSQHEALFPGPQICKDSIHVLTCPDKNLRKFDGGAKSDGYVSSGVQNTQR